MMNDESTELRHQDSDSSPDRIVFAKGWHAREGSEGGGYFRWMAGREATIELRLEKRGPYRLEIWMPGPELEKVDEGHGELTMDVNGSALDPTRAEFSGARGAWVLPESMIDSKEDSTLLRLRIGKESRLKDGRAVGMPISELRVEPCE